MTPVTTRPVPAARSPYFTRRAFLGLGSAAAVGLALYAGEIGRHDLVIERRTIRLKGLAECFAGLRIAQISDIHFMEYTEPFFVRRAVAEINRLKPDIVLLTGDFVSMAPIEKSRAVAYAPMVAEILGGIECPHRYGVLGNHDWMVDGAAVVDAMKSVGIPILHNENLPFERDGGRFWIAGIMDALSWESDIPKSLPTHAQKDREPVILMAHEPDVLPAVAHYNAVDLMLSGHTHGGQVRLPFLPPLLLPPLGKRFVEGHFQMGRTQLYVNRGIGAVGLPFRFRCPSEITELTLQPA
ncbi:metallophosphoesterase [Acidipila sp. EB88]|uniref:metallophosphoesterase n=1 Tax=Acidipila sp. EB88 TaxID=2305226 RepID=UPI000F5D994C|nr:metallophosphoesterase [Acidipila sp. EB88]RRA47347.1 metallophosphoesterase [Acidipila sp. EB88]